MGVKTESQLSGIWLLIVRLTWVFVAVFVLVLKITSFPSQYAQMIEATPADVQLVTIGGIRVYGDTSAMSNFWNTSDLQQLQVGITPKGLASPAINFTFADVVTRLQAALEAQGTTLAPLIEDSSAE